tara:strand:+ start:342 stop:605 length:264 start_codon:yes stop_codon:yes gene_type:complete
MDETLMYILGALALTLYWSIRGMIGMFQRHNTIVIILYLIILFPIAYIHMLLLGMFGDSKKERLKKAAEEKAKFDIQVENEKSKLNQ